MSWETAVVSTRNTEIPVSIDHQRGNRTLLLMAHSFKSDRFEDGRFSLLAEELCRQGISSIRLDFPGNGQSHEPLTCFDLKNCLDDLESCYRFITDRWQFDRFCLLGYSLGARIVTLFSKNHPEFSDLVIWAGCNDIFTERDDFLEQNLGEMKEGSRDGLVEFYDIYQDVYDLFPLSFIDDLITLDPLIALKQFKGRVLIIHGDNDSTVDISSAYRCKDNLIAAREKRLHIIEGADHGFGLWDMRPEFSDELLDETVRFLLQDEKGFRVE